PEPGRWLSDGRDRGSSPTGGHLPEQQVSRSADVRSQLREEPLAPRVVECGPGDQKPGGPDTVHRSPPRSRRPQPPGVRRRADGALEPPRDMTRPHLDRARLLGIAVLVLGALVSLARPGVAVGLPTDPAPAGVWPLQPTPTVVE